MSGFDSYIPKEYQKHNPQLDYHPMNCFQNSFQDKYHNHNENYNKVNPKYTFQDSSEQVEQTKLSTNISGNEVNFPKKEFCTLANE